MTVRTALFVVTDANIGGSTVVTLRFAQALAEMAHAPWKLEVLTPPEGRTAELFRAAGAPVHPLRLGDGAQRRLRAGRLRNALDVEASVAFQTLATLRRVRPDLVQVSDETSLLPVAPAARLAGIPLLWYVHNFQGGPRDRLLARVPRHLAHPTSRTRRRFAGIEGLGPGSEVPYPVDLRRFRPAADRRAARRALGLPEAAVLVGYVGNLQARKRPEWAVGVAEGLAAAGHAEVLTLLAGGDMDDGEYRRRLQERIARGGAPVRLLGARDDIDALMPVFDVLILTSDVDGEVLPLVTLEAAACGVPVVATDVGAVTDLIENEVTGLVVAPDDFAGYVRAVSRVLDEPETAARLSARALERVRSRHAPELHARAMMAAYDATIERATVATRAAA